jgi:hypothetical protein
MGKLWAVGEATVSCSVCTVESSSSRTKNNSDLATPLTEVNVKHVCVRVFVTEVNNLGLLVRRDRIDSL